MMNKSMIPNRDERIVVLENMKRYGGSFVQALAECFYRADEINFVILKTAFPDIWDKYKNFKNK